MRTRAPGRRSVAVVLLFALLLTIEWSASSEARASSEAAGSDEPSELIARSEPPAVTGELIDRLLEAHRGDLALVGEARSIWDTTDADRIDTAARLDAARASLLSIDAGSSQHRTRSLRVERLEGSLRAAEELTARSFLGLLAAHQAARSSEGAANTAIEATGTPDLPGGALLAYREAAAFAAATLPACAVTGATLAALGRTLRGALGAAVSGLGSDTLHRMVLATSVHDAAILCADDTSLATVDGLTAAVGSRLEADRPAAVSPDPDARRAPDDGGVLTVLAAARRYARNTVLGLGVPADAAIPADHTPSTATRFVVSPQIEQLLSWGSDRLGTPYSQCLGTQHRPLDPICPPGTDRFGNGFFDCSGFVSAAFGSIGIEIPATTEAMQDDAGFLSRTVATSFDGSVLPGDIFLMEGHTGIVLDDGEIMHAFTDGLVIEPLPNWVREHTFAIVRIAPPAGADPPST